MNLEKNSKLLFVGDSITDCNRDYNAIPAGWGSFGNGYVNLINSFLTGLAPEYMISVYNKGISGNTILDLEKRWERDVLNLSPDYVAIMIGINDVWHYYNALMQPIPEVNEETFEKTYENLILKTKDKVKEMYLFSPFMIIETLDYPMRKHLQNYINITKNLANKYSLQFINVQQKFDEFVKYLPAYTLSGDHVHPDLSGHMIIAKAFLDKINFKWS